MDLIEVVGSSDKHVGWQKFVGNLEDFLANPQSTSEELKRIHALMTSHAAADLTPKPIMEALTHDLYALDREDGQEKTELLHRWYKQRQVEFDGQHPYAVFQELKRMHKQLCEPDTEVKLETVIPGELRKLGQRRIKHGEWTTVYYAHTNMYDNDNPSPVILEEHMPKTYYGFTVGLAKVYAELCAKYDELMQQAGNGTIEDRLLAEGFLQMIGTRVLHPFWDGNGRSFVGHIALMLEREDVQARDPSVVDQAMYPLTQITERFLEYVLASSGLGFQSGKKHFSINFDHEYRHNYMTKLRDKLMQIISENIEGTSGAIDYFSNAAWQIQRVLIKNHLVAPTPSNIRRLAVEEHLLEAVPQIKRHKYLAIIPYSDARKI